MLCGSSRNERTKVKKPPQIFSARPRDMRGRDTRAGTKVKVSTRLHHQFRQPARCRPRKRHVWGTRQSRWLRIGRRHCCFQWHNTLAGAIIPDCGAESGGYWAWPHNVPEMIARESKCLHRVLSLWFLRCHSASVPLALAPATSQLGPTPF
jgi:hypothetical protein